MRIKNKTLWIGLSSTIVGLPIATIVSCENNSSKLGLAMKSIDKVIDGYLNGKNRILLTEFGSNNKSTTRIDEINEKNLEQWFENLPPIANANQKNNDGVTFYLRSVGAKGTSDNDNTTLEIKWIATKDNIAKEMIYTEGGFLASDAPVIKSIIAEKDSTGKVGITINGVNIPTDANEYKITKKNDPNTISGWNARVHDANKVILEKMVPDLSGELTISFVKYPSIKQNVMITEIKTLTATKDADGKVTITIEGNGLPTKETDFEIKNSSAIDGWKIEGTPSPTQVVLSKIDADLSGELTVSLVNNLAISKNVTIELLKSTITKVSAEKNSANEIGITIEGTNLPSTADKYKITKKGETTAITNWTIAPHGEGKFILKKTDENLSGELTVLLIANPSDPKDVMITEIKTLTATKDADGKVTITIEGNGLPTKETDFEIKKAGTPEGEKIDGWQIEGTPSPTQVVLSKTDDALTGELIVTLVNNPTLNKKVTIKLLETTITKASAEKNSANEISITIEGTNLPSTADKYKVTKKDDQTPITGWTIAPHGEGKFILKKTDPNLLGELTISLINNPAVIANVTIVEIKNVIVEKNNDGSVYIAIEGNGLPIVASEFKIKKAGTSDDEIIDGWQIEGKPSPTKVILKKDNEPSLNINDNLEIWLVNNPTINSVVAIKNNYFIVNHATGELMGYIGTSKEIEIPKLVNGIEIKSIAQEAFKDKGITKLTFAIDSVIETIGNSAFIGNSISGELIIPASVKTIDNASFYSNKITKLTFASGSKISLLGYYAFADNEISGLLDLSHLDYLRGTREAIFNNNKITELKFGRNLLGIGSHVFSNNKISKVNSTIEGECRFYYGTTYGGSILETSVNSNAFINNAIQKVFTNEKVALRGPGPFDANVQIITKASTDYDENGVLKDSSANTIVYFENRRKKLAR